MSYYYDYFLGKRGKETRKVSLAGPFNRDGKALLVLTRSRSFGTYLRDEMSVLPPDEWGADLEERFTYDTELTEAAGLTKADRKTKTPVVVTVKMDGARAFDAGKADLKNIRAQWACIANEHLAEHAAKHNEPAVTIDHRSFKDRRIEYVPTVHEGQRPSPERVAMNVEARETNRAIDRVVGELRQLKERAGMIEAAAPHDEKGGARCPW